MATKVEKKTKKTPANAAGVDDLSILAPDGEITIGGEKIVVREYRFWEGLRLKVTAKPFFDGLFELLGGDKPVEEVPPPSFEDVLELVASHDLIVAGMVAVAVDRPIEWVEGLREADGDALLLTWWHVNSGFFFRSVFRRAMQTRLVQKHPDGHASTTR